MLWREEIVDLVIGLGLTVLDRDSPRETGKKEASSEEFNLDNFGWNKRLKTGMENFLASATKDDCKNAGLRNAGF